MRALVRNLFFNVIGFIVSVCLVGFVVQKKNYVDGLPPQLGEHLVKNNKLEVGPNTIEIEGVCKLSEDSARCWKPDGSTHKSLSEKITTAIQHSREGSPRYFNVALLKKRRILIVKQSIRDSNRSSYGYGQIFQDRLNSGGFNEGWQSYSNTNFSASEQGFDGSSTNWSTIEGTFSSTRTEYPLRYAYLNPPGKPITRPLEPGKFEVDGNVYEIVSKKDHVKSGKAIPHQYPTYGAIDFEAEPRTEVIFRVIAVTNPHSSIGIQPADAQGKAIQYSDENDGEISPEQYDKWVSDYYSLPQGTPKPKCPYHPVGSFNFDPKDYSPSPPDQTMYFYLGKDKCVNMSIHFTKRDIYVFDKIKLDPK